jgi:hypothetical protein
MSGEQEDDKNGVEKLLAAVTAVARDDDLAVARLPTQAFAPLSASDRAKIADRILRPRAAEPERERPKTGDVVVSLDSRRRKGRWRLMTALAPLALAAAVVVALRSFSGVGPGPLPGYEIIATGGIRETRGAETASSQAGAMVAAPQRLRPRSRLLVIARPRIAVEGPVATRVFVVQGNKAAEVWPQVQIAASGAVEVRAPVAEVFGGRMGHWELVVLIGRSEALRRTDADAAVASPSDPRWRRLIVPLDFEAE